MRQTEQPVNGQSLPQQDRAGGSRVDRQGHRKLWRPGQADGCRQRRGHEPSPSNQYVTVSGRLSLQWPPLHHISDLRLGES